MASRPNNKWAVVGLCAWVGALNYADRSAVSSVFPLLRTDLTMSDVQLAAVGSFFLWAYAFMSPLAGMVADRFSRSLIVVLSLAGWSAVTLVTAFVTTAEQLLVTRVLLGFFEAAYIPTAVALLADYHGPETRATAMGLHAASLPLGVVAGGVGFGYMGEHLGWRTGFIVLGGLGIVIAIVVRFALRDAPRPARIADTPRRRASVIANFAELLHVPSYVLIVGANMCIGVVNWIFINWLPLYFKESFGLSLAGAGFAGTFTHHGAGLLAGLLGSVFSDRVAGTNPRRRMLIQGVAYGLAAPFALIFFLPQPALSLINLGIFTFSFLLSFGACNASPLTCDLLPARLRSTAIGVGNALNCFAGGIGVMVSGYLKAGVGLGGVFGGVSGMTLLAAGFILVGYAWFLPRDLAAPRPESPP